MVLLLDLPYYINKVGVLFPGASDKLAAVDVLPTHKLD